MINVRLAAGQGSMSDVRSSGGAASSGSADPGDSAVPAGEHEEIPEIPPRIRQSIRGHVRVSVRVIVDEESNVFAALVDSPGLSKYFDRVAIEAAKKWTFPPPDSTSRLKLVKFDFTREGATGQAVTLQ
jgi:outer membrane biosynthesis protein TonB